MFIKYYNEHNYLPIYLNYSYPYCFPITDPLITLIPHMIYNIQSNDTTVYFNAAVNMMHKS